MKKKKKLRHDEKIKNERASEMENVVTKIATFLYEVSVQPFG
jgi:hypothetical protein